LSWPLPADLSERELEAAFFSLPKPPKRAPAQPLPDFQHISEELRSHKHATLQLLWEEYRANHPHGFSYSRFCHHYRHWKH
jgi:transposase